MAREKRKPKRKWKRPKTQNLPFRKGNFWFPQGLKIFRKIFFSKKIQKALKHLRRNHRQERLVIGMEDNIMQRCHCYARQENHLRLDEAIMMAYFYADEILDEFEDDHIYEPENTWAVIRVANFHQIALYLEELRCARNDIEKLKAEVKELRETKRRYKDMLSECGGKDDETIRLEDFIKAFYKHLEEHHNEESKDKT